MKLEKIEFLPEGKFRFFKGSFESSSLDVLFVQIQLSDYYTYRKLLKFTLPSILSMLFTSVYGVVDGLFVLNVVEESAFASINQYSVS